MQERESTIELDVPGMCCADTKKLCVAAIRKRLRRRCMMCGQWEEPEVTEGTTVALSQWKQTFNVGHLMPHTRVQKL